MNSERFTCQKLCDSFVSVVLIVRVEREKLKIELLKFSLALLTLTTTQNNTKFSLAVLVIAFSILAILTSIYKVQAFTLLGGPSVSITTCLWRSFQFWNEILNIILVVLTISTLSILFAIVWIPFELMRQLAKLCLTAEIMGKLDLCLQCQWNWVLSCPPWSQEMNVDYGESHETNPMWAGFMRLSSTSPVGSPVPRVDNAESV